MVVSTGFSLHTCMILRNVFFLQEDSEVKKLDLSAGSNSKLAPEVQSLIKMIFDVESMKKAMLEFEVSLTRT